MDIYTDVTKELKQRKPFSLEIPNKLITRDSISEAEFNKMMATGLAQAKADDSLAADEAFSNLRLELAKIDWE